VSSEVDSAELKPGLRERKKQQTRDTIAAVALKLFAERGFSETTLADIAEAADVSPRTIFGYFDSKEDILFCEEPGMLSRLKRMLDERPPGKTTVDAIREFVSQLEPGGEDARLRKKIITGDPGLERKIRARHAELEPLFAASIAKDLDTQPDDIRPVLAAASITAAINSMRDRFLEAESGGESMTLEQGIAMLDQVLEFLRGGLEALRAGGSPASGLSGEQRE
jgi:AcrR family transcriptional regulator